MRPNNDCMKERRETYRVVAASGSVERALVVVDVAVTPDWMKALHVAT